MEQWTVTYDDPKTQEQALIKIRFTPFAPEIIEFVVELNSIPIDDEKGKDVTVNWKMFNGWDSQKTFWTDSSSLEMEERNIRELNRDDETFAGNMYPVTSAIAMRDFRNGSNTQVTVMNDRAQAGSADLSDNSTIEIIQHRRTLRDDHKGVEEPLNETDTFDDYGLQVNARYYMQIFNAEKGKSL
jgi:alpha-mannosidase